MKAVRCPICNLLVGPDADHLFGEAAVLPTLNHAPQETDEGFAEVTETPICQGSDLLGQVETLGPSPVLVKRIHTGYYDNENGTAQFKRDVLDTYGEHEETYRTLFRQHANLPYRARLEQTLAEFVKVI